MHNTLIPLCVVLLCCVLTSCTDAATVSCAQDLIDLFRNATGGTLLMNIDVVDDLDFSQTKLIQPLGMLHDGTCRQYSGTLRGNGHTIKGLVMDNINKKEKLNDAGLFCYLHDVRIENLVIDSSCVFRGSSAGALCVIATGSLTLTQITNKASVIGDQRLGGFIGYSMHQLKVFTFEHCSNEGNVYGTMGVGGFIGLMFDVDHASFFFSNSINGGSVSGFTGIGGFIGAAYHINEVDLTVHECQNNGTINYNPYDYNSFEFDVNTTTGVVTVSKDTSKSVATAPGSINKEKDSDKNVPPLGYGGFFGLFVNTSGLMAINKSMNNGRISGIGMTGGFVGVIVGGERMNIELSNSMNNGVVSKTTHIINDSVINMSKAMMGDDNISFIGACFGGFAGAIGGVNTNIIIGNSTNNGSVSGNVSIGGFIGEIESSPQNSLTLSIINSVNKGNISANDDLACGLFCVNGTKNDNVNATVMNSMNKGIVDGNRHGYGITDIITKANNVVSIGEVIGSSSAFSFWVRSTDVYMVYCKQDNCKSYDSFVILFECDNETKNCKDVEDETSIDDLLNEESERHQYGMMWNNELELVKEIKRQSEKENESHKQVDCDKEGEGDENQQNTEAQGGLSQMGGFFKTVLTNIF